MYRMMILPLMGFALCGCQTISVQVAPKGAGAISVNLDHEIQSNKTHATMKWEIKL